MNPHPTVTTFLHALEHPLKPEILRVREIILSASSGITEHIKWNAPSFCADGDDRITMKYHPPKNVQLVFHRGAKVKTQPPTRLIEDPFGMLKWAANDRAVATFNSMDEIDANREKLVRLVNLWIAAC